MTDRGKTACAVAWTIAAASWAAPVTAQTVRVLVFDATTDAPIELAEVVAIEATGGPVATGLTDANGMVDLELPDDGHFVVRATALGYSTTREGPLELEDDGLRVVYVRMSPEALRLQGLTVEASTRSGRLPRLIENGFEERRAEGRGYFFTPGDIAESDAYFIHELFEPIDLVIPEYGTPIWERWVSIINLSGRGNCRPRVWVDGKWMRPDFVFENEGLDDIVPLDELLAAELYVGPFQAPMNFQGTMKDNSCGVLLLWTLYGR